MAAPQATGSARTWTSAPANGMIAAKLDDYAALLEQQQANPFRVRAYQRAAKVIGALDRPVGDILAGEGVDGLIALPGVGTAIAGAVAQLASTGVWPQLERLRGALNPEALFRTLPGVGPRLARELAEEMHIDSLEALEIAASDGSLDRARGWGPKRVAMVRAALAERLGRVRPRGQSEPRPSVALILEVDAEYRRKAAAGALRLIAPRRFNPSGEAWLPILHAERGPWRFTAAFSNTARAHDLHREHDWVVIYHQLDSTPEGQSTVVTETSGPLAGRRVVRGRERECETLTLP
jgi:hypothetical protein